jgi:hypothetical protein
MKTDSPKNAATSSNKTLKKKENPVNITDSQKSIIKGTPGESEEPTHNTSAPSSNSNTDIQKEDRNSEKVSSGKPTIEEMINNDAISNDIQLQLIKTSAKLNEIIGTDSSKIMKRKPNDTEIDLMKKKYIELRQQFDKKNAGKLN